ncbi:hypothetical protein J2S30_001900 [Herbaspirillum rubrisubalbicans]|nr:hypothetical protein [Herbaspirillum rubrisubalbicans]
MPDLFLFLLAAMTLTLAPGPDNLYVLTRGIAQGRQAGLVAAAGFCSGLIFHTLLAVLGFAALIKAYAPAYHALQYAGAAYLALSRRAHAALGLGRHRAGCGWARHERRTAAPHLLAKRAGQHAQSQGDAVLHRLPAAVRAARSRP